MLPDLNISSLKVDGCIVNDPALCIGQIPQDDLLASEFNNFSSLECIGLDAEIRHLLSHLDSGLDSLKPFGIVKHSVNGGAHLVQIKSRSLVQGFDDFRKIH
jgi:hypothetical protein